jgi:hypothetical protein
MEASAKASAQLAPKVAEALGGDVVKIKTTKI